MALARMKPPMNRKIIGLANAAKAVPTVTTPVITARVGPISEVTGIGTGSVIHHKATRTMMASSLCAARVSPAIGVMNTRMASNGPPKSPIVRRLRSKACSARLTAVASLLILSKIIRLLYVRPIV